MNGRRGSDHLRDEPDFIPESERNAAMNQEMTGRTVIAVFTERQYAERAIRDLKAAGFSEEQLGVAVRDQDEQRELISETGATGVTGTKAAEGVATGAASGGILGGIIGLLTGTGAIVIPGLGPVVAAGVLASTFTGMGVGAAAGGIIGGLAGLGVPEEDARYFDSGFRQGGTIVTVNAGQRTGEAIAVLQEHQGDVGPSESRNFQTSEGSGAGRYGTSGHKTEYASESDTSDEAWVGSEEPDTARAEDARRSGYNGRERRAESTMSYMGPERRLVGGRW
jgi:hypothetical protein